MDNDVQKPAKRLGKSSLHAALDSRNQTPKGQFKTPEEVAAADDISQPAPLVEQVDTTLPDSPSSEQGGSGSWRDRFQFNWPPGKREWIIMITAAVVLIGLVLGILSVVGNDKPTGTHSPRTKVHTSSKPKSSLEPSRLTGELVTPIVNKGPITGVMVENSIDARPQSGLSQAGVVFEAIAEGGITRFLALFDDAGPSNIGPIRSARPYYAQWALGFDAGYAHVGGSPEALQNIRDWNVRDLDQFYNGGSYHRVSSRAAPHNVYTSIAALNQLEFSKGYDHSNFTGFLRKPKGEPSAHPTARSIDFNISGPTYNVHYSYNGGTNSYERSEGGAAHIDANTNKQISPKVVIALVMPYSIESDGYHSDYSTIGSGPAYIYQDATVTVGTWKKTSAASQFTFADAQGHAIGLNPGQTWLTALRSAGEISSAP